MLPLGRSRQNPVHKESAFPEHGEGDMSEHVLSLAFQSNPVIVGIIPFLSWNIETLPYLDLHSIVEGCYAGNDSGDQDRNKKCMTRTVTCIQTEVARIPQSDRRASTEDVPVLSGAGVTIISVEIANR